MHPFYAVLVAWCPLPWKFISFTQETHLHILANTWLTVMTPGVCGWSKSTWPFSGESEKAASTLYISLFVLLLVWPITFTSIHPREFSSNKSLGKDPPNTWQALPLCFQHYILITYPFITMTQVIWPLSAEYSKLQCHPYKMELDMEILTGMYRVKWYLYFLSCRDASFLQ